MKLKKRIKENQNQNKIIKNLQNRMIKIILIIIINLYKYKVKYKIKKINLISLNKIILKIRKK